MTSYTLTGFVSPSSTPPTFVIPIFSCSGSNETFAQDLSASGSVTSFKLINTELFHSVNVLAPPFDLDIGDEGVWAYWAQPSLVVADHPSRIKQVLSSTDSDAYTDLEIGAITGDRDRVVSAAALIANTLGGGGIAARWHSGELTTFDDRVFVDYEPVRTPSLDDNHWKSVYDTLVGSPEQADWANTWHRLWKAASKRSDLTRVAMWWIDAGYARGEQAGLVFDTLLRHGVESRITASAELWLRSHDFGIRQWPNIWLSILPRTDIREDHLNLASQKMRDAFEKKSFSILGWCLVWSVCWRSIYQRDELIELAKMMASIRQVVTRPFVEYVGNVLIAAEITDDSIISAVRQWLFRNSKSTVLYASTFVSLISLRPEEELIRRGRYWLSAHGGNMNGWFDVWKSVEGFVGQDERIDLAINWMRRARWDLTAWSRTFNELSTMVLSKTAVESLINLGDRWLTYHSGSPHQSRKIKQAVSYLQMTES